MAAPVVSSTGHLFLERLETEAVNFCHEKFEKQYASLEEYAK